MPATFDAFGIKFLYPDNWSLSTGAAEEGVEGLTLELPSGGFLSIEITDEDLSDAEVFQQVADAIEDEYDGIESEEVRLAHASEGEQAIDLRFFYLDLLIVLRVVLLSVAGRRLLVQFQAESRDFEANQLVLDAILEQLRR